MLINKIKYKIINRLNNKGGLCVAKTRGSARPIVQIIRHFRSTFIPKIQKDSNPHHFSFSHLSSAAPFNGNSVPISPPPPLLLPLPRRHHFTIPLLSAPENPTLPNLRPHH